jgi:cytochrome c peroxidase
MGGDGGKVQPTPYPFAFPPGFPKPSEPLDNPTTVENVELGRHLFYDVRLSENNSLSCASCHQQERAFSDGRILSRGSTGQSTPRNSMTLANVAYASTLTWSNPLLLTLEQQTLVPMFGDTPIELGIRKPSDIENELAEIPRYQDLFRAAFPEADVRPTLKQITQALAAFQRTLISSNAPFDKWLRGEMDSGMSEAAIRGYQSFNSEELECFHCHQGFNLSDHVHWQGKAFFEAIYHNTGLYNVDGEGAYPEPNRGTYDVTLRPADMGKFKAPTLRNIVVTGPYMHDGSIDSLDGALDHYARGGRMIESGENQGDGFKSPLKDPLIAGFELTAQQRSDVMAFFEALTDQDFLTNPKWSDPWASP